MSAPNLVLFDLDGTLIDSEYNIAKITLEVARSENCDLDIQTAFCEFGGLSFKDRFNAVAKMNNREFSEAKLRDMHTKYQRRKEKMYLNPNINLIKGARDLVERLALHPDKILGLASSNVCERSKMVINNIKLAHHFGDRVYGSDQVGGVKKPRPDIYNFAMQGYDPERVLVVEDSLPGVIAGRAAGAFVVAHVDSRQGLCESRNQTYIDAGADVIVNNYDDFEAIVAPKWKYWQALKVA